VKKSRSVLAATTLLAAVVVATGAPGATASAGPGDQCLDQFPWCNERLAPDRRADMVLRELTQQEKFELMGGQLTADPPYHAINEPVERLGIPRVFFRDGPAGPRGSVSVGLPYGVSLGAAFDPELARRYGRVVAQESRSYGADVVLGPMMNIVRNPTGGRTFETYGEDPLLMSETGVGYIRGVQSEGLIANAKHYAANNQETDRFLNSSDVDERTLREIYLPHFEAAVKRAGVGTVMCAYNRVNGRKACENPALLERTLRGEWGFDGFVLSDFDGAVTSTEDAANAGLDLELGQAKFYQPALLTPLVASGRIGTDTVDEHVHAILRTMFAFGVFDRPAHPTDGKFDLAAHQAFARETAREGTVLLRNDGALPLGPEVRSVAVIGPEADVYKNPGAASSAALTPAEVVTIREGIARRLGPGGEVAFSTDDPEVARGADAAVVVVSDSAGEHSDRSCLALSCAGFGDQDELVRDVARVNPRTVVVVQSGGPVLMPWAEEVEAIAEAWYPGARAGEAVADVLFGDADPGGRLPMTFPREEADKPAHTPAQFPGEGLRSVYSEGIFVGYRHYDERGIEPLFPFGHGLSYTSWDLSKLRVRRGHKGAARVRVSVENTGERAGSQVVQIYVGKPDRASLPQPPRSLAGFAKVRLDPGERKEVRMRLPARSFSSWVPARGEWRVVRGCHALFAGTSSRKLPLRAKLPRAGGRCGPRHGG
jgi:beta-glucosidase-like glycosyl hydrolase